MKMKSASIRNLILAAIAIRLAIAAVFFHGDLMFIWERSAEVYYPPLTYFLFSLMSPLLILSRLVGFWLLKMPYLAADMLILRMILKLVPNEKRKETVWLWGFNPIVLYGTYAQGQMEIILAALLVWSAALVGRKRVGGGVLALSAAAALKTQPVFLLPVVAMLMGRSWQKILWFLGIGASLPVIFGLGYQQLTGTDAIASYFPKVAAPTIELAMRPDMVLTWIMLAVGLGIYCLLMWKLWKHRNKYQYVSAEVYISALMAALAAIFIANPANLFHRYVLLVPILILFVARQKLSAKIVWGLGILLFLGHIYTWPLTWGLVEHLWPETVSFPALRELVAKWVKYEHLALAFQTLAKLILFWVAVRSLRCIGNDQVSSLQNQKKI